MKSVWTKSWLIGLSIGLVVTIGASAPADQKKHAPWTGPYADEIPYPTPDDVWLSMGWSKKQTSSKCIGKNITPLCAVETYFASDVRGIGSLGAQAMGKSIVPGSEKPIPGYIPFPRSGLMRYQLLSVTRVTEALAEEILAQDPNQHYQPGDVTMHFMWQMCGHADAQGHLSNCCIPKYSESGFLLRRRSEGWVVIEGNHPIYVGRSYIYWNPRPEDERSTGGAEFHGTPHCEEIKARTNADTY